MATGFDFRPRTRIVYGAGGVDRLGELARELSARHVLLVTDPNLVAAGHVARAEQALAAAGLESRRYDGVRENPTTEDVDACLEFARGGPVELLVGFGGGSSIDTAKGCNFLLSGGGRMQDYKGLGKLGRPMLPMIAVPTTAGTGSEVQSFALISTPDDHRKMACGDPQVAPRVAVLDPQLTVSMPRHVTACTGLDTVAHAVETAVTRSRNAISGLYSREAFRLAQASLARVLAAPDDLEARGHMLVAAAFAGLAIESSMLGASHSMANPLTARFDVPHGHAVGLFLPLVVRFNAADPGAAREYAGLTAAAGLDAGPGDAVEQLVGALEGLLAASGLPRRLSACGVPGDALDQLAGEAAQQWTARHNPREVGVDEFRALYRAAWAADS